MECAFICRGKHYGDITRHHDRLSRRSSRMRTLNFPPSCQDFFPTPDAGVTMVRAASDTRSKTIYLYSCRFQSSLHRSRPDGVTAG